MNIPTHSQIRTFAFAHAQILPWLPHTSFRSLFKSHPLSKESLDHFRLQTLFIHISKSVFFHDAMYHTYLSYFSLCPLLECIFHEVREFLAYFSSITISLSVPGTQLAFIFFN